MHLQTILQRKGINDMQMKIFLQSGINGNGFKIRIEDEYNEIFNYGENASCNKKTKSDSKPFVSDILLDLMMKYNIDPLDVRIIELNTPNKITQDNFIDDYLREAVRKYNNLAPRTKPGRWIADRYCSECEWDKHDAEIVNNIPTNFCPNCGAYMKAGENK